MTTNMQVVQTSVFLKYRPFFVFLQRHAPTVASEVQRAYVGAARTYFETGFRRYIRSLGWVKVAILSLSICCFLDIPWLGTDDVEIRNHSFQCRRRCP